MLHFKRTRGIEQVQTTEADRIYRATVIEMLAKDPEYTIAITAARFASILLMSGPNDSVPHSLYMLGADMSIYTLQSLSCYQQTFGARGDFSLCDGDYIGLNPGLTHGPSRRIPLLNGSSG